MIGWYGFLFNFRFCFLGNYIFNIQSVLSVFKFIYFSHVNTKINFHQIKVYLISANDIKHKLKSFLKRHDISR